MENRTLTIVFSLTICIVIVIVGMFLKNKIEPEKFQQIGIKNIQEKIKFDYYRNLEELYRKNILRDYEKLDEINLEGNQILEIKNSKVVINGNIFLKDNSKLVIENSEVLWNNSYFVEFLARIDDNATFKINDSILLRNDPTNLNIYPEGGTLQIINSICFYDIWVHRGKVIIDSSKIVGNNGIGWYSVDSFVSINNSLVNVVDLEFPSGDYEEVHISNLKFGKNKFINISTKEGSILELKNTQVGIERGSGGWVLSLEDGEEHEGWQPGIPVNREERIIPHPNKKHYILENCELWAIWTRFGTKSNVEISNWKAKYFDFWHFRDEAKTSNVNFDFTLINTSLIYWKLLTRGKAHYKNLQDIQISSWWNATIVAEDCIIPYALNLRGDGEKVKLKNSKVVSDIEMLDFAKVDPFGGDEHYLELENTIIDSRRIEIATTYTKIKGSVKFLSKFDDVQYEFGTVEREYPVRVLDSDNKPLKDVEILLFDYENRNVWKGRTDKNGEVFVTINFTEKNWKKYWKIVVPEYDKAREVRFLTNTPIIFFPNH